MGDCWVLLGVWDPAHPDRHIQLDLETTISFSSTRAMRCLCQAMGPFRVPTWDHSTALWDFASAASTTGMPSIVNSDRSVPSFFQQAWERMRQPHPI